MLTDLSQVRPSADEVFCTDSRLFTLDPFSEKQQESFEEFDDTKAERACRLLCQRVKRDKELEVHFLQHFKSEDSLLRLVGEKKYALVLSSVVRVLLDLTLVQEQTALMKRLREDTRKLELEKRYSSATAFEAIIEEVKKATLDLQASHGRYSEFYERPNLASELRRKPVSARNTVSVSRECKKAKMRADLDNFKFKYLPQYDVERIRKATEEAEKECHLRRSTSRKSKQHEPVIGKPRSSQPAAEARGQPAMRVSDVARVSLNSEVNLTIPPSLCLAKHPRIERFESFKEGRKESAQVSAPFAPEVPNIHNSEKFIRLEDPKASPGVGLSDRVHRTPTQAWQKANHFPFGSSSTLKAQKLPGSNLQMLYRPLEVPNYSIKPIKKLSQKKSLQKLQQQASLQEEVPPSKGYSSPFEGLRSSSSLAWKSPH